jgi:hypothetical protein
MTSIKTSVKKKVIHFSIQSLRSLLKTIKRFLKTTYKDRVIYSQEVVTCIFVLVNPHARRKIEHPFNGPPIYVRQQGLEQGR